MRLNKKEELPLDENDSAYEESADVEVYDVIPDDVRAMLAPIDLEARSF